MATKTKIELEYRIKELEHENNELKLQISKRNQRGAGRKKKIDEDLEQEVQRSYVFGSTMDMLAKKFKLSKGTIFNILHAD